LFAVRRRAYNGLIVETEDAAMLFQTLFQGRNLLIMIGLGAFVFLVIYLMARRMVRRMTPQDVEFYRHLGEYQRRRSIAKLLGYGVALLIMAIFWLLNRR
jgi:hypothetical protein